MSKDRKVVVAAIEADEYLTVAEAATLLKVSQATVWRWIGRGELPAYRVGQRRVRLRRDDLDRAVTPIARAPEESQVLTSLDEIRALEPISEEKRRRMFAAAEASRRLQAAQLKERGGKRFSPSWELINESRDVRTRELDWLS
jgi:excisionase family DNA binding protein